MEKQVDKWLRENSGSHLFPWGVQVLSSAVLLILCFGIIGFLIDEWSKSTPLFLFYFLVSIGFLFITYGSFRALFLARRLHVSEDRLLVEPAGFSVSANDIASVGESEFLGVRTIALKMRKHKPVFLPGNVNFDRTSYKIRVRKKRPTAQLLD